jgi:hypothetical protein
MFKSWWSRRRSDAEERSALREVDEWPPLLGQPLTSLFEHVDGQLPHGPGVAIITGPNSVGTRRVAPMIDRTGAFVTWLIHDNNEPVRVPVEGVTVRLRKSLQETLPLPHALFVGDDGRIWRHSYVGIVDSWIRFVDGAHTAFVSSTWSRSLGSLRS